MQDANSQGEAMAETEIRELRRKLAEAELAKKEAELAKKEAELAKKEAELAKKEAELAKKEAESRLASTDLRTYLENCHTLSKAIRVATDRSSVTSGVVTKPENRIYPKRITVSDDFMSRQDAVWRNILDSSFASKKQFANENQLEFILHVAHPKGINAEIELRHFHRTVVEDHAGLILRGICAHEPLKQLFGLHGNLYFENHTNLSGSGTDLSSAFQKMTIGGTTSNTSATISKSGPADRFCIYEEKDDTDTPVIAVEYKPPHKLPVSQLLQGFTEEIQPERDIFGREEDSPEFRAKFTVAAVVTQLFSYMIRKSVLYGLICTGEALLFVQVDRSDPSMVSCALHIPNNEASAGDECFYPRTAVAQIVAYVLRSLHVPPCPQSWVDATHRLEVWPPNEVNIGPETPSPKNRKKNLGIDPTYRGRRDAIPSKMHMTLRSSCRPAKFPECRDSTSPSRSRSRGPIAGVVPHSTSVAPQCTDSGQTNARNDSSGSPPQNSTKEETQRKCVAGAYSTARIQDRPYCSQLCLLGLKHRTLPDPMCPNFADHEPSHISLNRLSILVRQQITTDRGHDADSCVMHLKGSRGALFKIRLSSHGYTFVAKGMVHTNLHHLEHERAVYDVLQDLQGSSIPVCLGTVNLDPSLPLHYDGRRYIHLILLSWAGRPIRRCLSDANTKDMLRQLESCLKAIHGKAVLHKDVEARNLQWDDKRGRLMIIDFERALILPYSLRPSANAGAHANHAKQFELEKFNALHQFRTDISLAPKRFP